MWCAGDWETYMEGISPLLYPNLISLADSTSASQPYMNWWMDILGSVYGGGVFCALIMIGLNVSNFSIFPDLFANIKHSFSSS
jgi:choline transport protein